MTNRSTEKTMITCPAEIENARAYLAETVAMEAELLAAGDKVAHIQLGFIRCAAQDRLRELERAAYRAALATTQEI